MTYRRAPLAVPAMLPVITAITVNGRTRQIAWAEETVQLKDYGDARQITLFEHGRVVLQILTSDFDACPAEILAWLKSRWREENFLKYASENYGIDKICDYLADIETNTKIVGQPGPQAGERRRPRRGEDPGRRRARPGRAARRPGHHRPPSRTPGYPRRRRRRSPAPASELAAAADGPRRASPRNCPPTRSTPSAQAALLRTGRRGLQMVLRLLAHNAEHWLSGHLNAYLRDDDEYRAITRQTIIRGLAGTITCTPAAITVTLEQPAAPRVARALALLIDEINATPPAMPGDTRPITYQLTAQPGI